MPASATIPEYMRLLPDESLGRLLRLSLMARGLVEGTVSGRHRSPYKGSSVEFAEHRQYTRGDDLRNIDWRIYGKVDRYYVKQYIEETNLRAMILLDSSGSMGFAGDAAAKIDGQRPDKLRYAQYLAAAFTYLMIHQQDAAGLVTFDSEIRTHLPARNRSSQIRVILEQLYKAKPGGETNLAPILHDIAERIPARGLVVVISDLFAEPGELVRALQHFRYRKHEVILLHVLAEEELTFPFASWTNFRSLEAAGVEVQLDPKSIRAVYLERLRQFVRTIELACGRMRIDYVPINTKTPYVEALSNYLASRQR